MKNLLSENITPEMIAAGREVLNDYEFGWCNASEYVARIFQAMQRAQRYAAKSSQYAHSTQLPSMQHEKVD